MSSTIQSDLSGRTFTAVAVAREISGHNPLIVERRADNPKAHVPGASAESHRNVRRIVTERINGEVTAKAIVAQAGCKTYKELYAIATFQPDTKTDTLRALSALMFNGKGKPDQWARGRYLAAILCAWIKEVRAEARASKA